MNKIIQSQNNKAKFISKIKTVIIAGFILVFTASIQVKAADMQNINSVSQLIKEKKLTLNLKSKSLRDILVVVKQQTGIGFAISPKVNLAELQTLSVEAKNEDVAFVLEKLLSKTNYKYEIVHSEIVIVPKTINQPTSKQQSRVALSVNGKVIDENGAPVVGATVLALGSSAGAITNNKGEFILNTFVGTTVEISFVGLHTYKLVLKSEDKALTVKMKSDALAVDDVVVTGIFTRKAESFTGSAASFKAEELKQVGAQNVLQSLKTLDPSFNILESREFGSDPNRLPDIEIRGKSSVVGLKEEYGTDPNQPLFILDGFETDLKTVIDLNMDRVASVTILKDAASTAIYGSKAANGVVVIETKRPEKGKFKVSYSGNMYVSMPDLSDYNLMNSSEKLIFEQEAGRYKAKSGANEQLFLDSLYNLNKAEIARGVDTYWMNEPLRVVINHKHNLYAEGGDENVRYGIGANYNTTKGVMKNSGNELAGAYFDLTYRVKRLNIMNKMNFDYYTQEEATVPFSSYSKSNPYYRKTNEFGVAERYLANYLTLDKTEYKVENPLYKSTLNSFNESKKIKFENRLNAEYSFMPQLILRGRFGLGTSVSKGDRFTSPSDPMYDRTKYDSKGSYTSGIGQDFFYDGDITLSYGKLFGEKHQFNAVVGARMRSSSAISETNSSTGFPLGDFMRPSFASGYVLNSKPSYSKSESRSNSVYFNGGYSFANRYLLDANFRIDGSSVFGTNKQHSQTWAVGLGWNVHNEKFLKGIKVLDRLKLRASVGNPGNQNYSSFQALTTYMFNNAMQNPFGVGMIIDKYGNPDLKWQKTLDKNIGFDLTMFGNRLNVIFDYYDKLTDPLLVSISIPSSVGTKSILTNLGEQQGSGFSGTVKYSPIYRPKDRVTWTLSANFRHNKAVYQNIGNSLDKFNEQNKGVSLVRYYDGGDPSSLWAVRSLGINPSDGREVFIKKDGTYTFEHDVKDEVIVGNSTPTLEGVLGSTLYYKGFSFSLYFRYSFGADVFTRATYSKVENLSLESLKYNQDRRALYDRWRKPGDVAKFKGISLTETTPMTSRFVLQENYIKAESISFGYDFDSKLIREMGFQSLRLQGSMNDLFRISSIKEERGIEYPFARQFSLSVSVTF